MIFPAKNSTSLRKCFCKHSVVPSLSRDQFSLPFLRGTELILRLRSAPLRMPFLLGSAITLAACSSAVTPDKISRIKPGMKTDQVEAILGRPAHIDQSETADQSVTGEVDHYPAPNGEGRVIFVNNAVFKAEFVPGAKS